MDEKRKMKKRGAGNREDSGRVSDPARRVWGQIYNGNGRKARGNYTNVQVVVIVSFGIDTAMSRELIPQKRAEIEDQEG